MREESKVKKKTTGSVVSRRKGRRISSLMNCFKDACFVWWLSPFATDGAVSIVDVRFRLLRLERMTDILVSRKNRNTTGAEPP